MERVTRKTRVRDHVSWTSAAFIVESILLLLFLVASLGVLTKVFTASLNRSIESRSLDAATIAATSIAEHFTADPTGIDESTQMGDLLIKCDVTEEATSDGTIYHANITVYDVTGAHGSEAAYSIKTARYVGNTTSSAASASSGSTNASASAASASSTSSASAASASASSASAAASGQSEVIEDETAQGETIEDETGQGERKVA